LIAHETALCIDFDGTLAPIVDDPAAARPFPGALDLLAALAECFAAVALVSGRPAAYLAEHAPARGVRYFGLYGLQEIRDGELFVDPRLLEARDAVEAAAADVRAHDAVRASGAHLEDKTYAVGVHLRRVSEPERWSAHVAGAAEQIARQHGLEVVPGRLVWELRPAVSSDKGDAVRSIVAEVNARGVAVIGDDIGDLPAFAAAAGLGAQGMPFLRVAVRSAETPPELLAAADLVVDGPDGVRSWLEGLLRDARTAAR